MVVAIVIAIIMALITVIMIAQRSPLKCLDSVAQEWF